jgi:uncharacterized protein HemY
MYTLDTILTHISTIQKHIDVLDTYKKNNVLNDGQLKRYHAQRKVYRELLQTAQDIYTAVKVVNEISEKSKRDGLLQRSISVLSNTRPTPEAFEVWKVAYKNNCLHLLKGHPDTPLPSRRTMDLNRFDCQ